MCDRVSIANTKHAVVCDGFRAVKPSADTLRVASLLLVLVDVLVVIVAAAVTVLAVTVKSVNAIAVTAV